MSAERWERCVICQTMTSDRCSTPGHDHAKCADQEACHERYLKWDAQRRQEARDRTGGPR